jgi:hypothetical protein
MHTMKALIFGTAIATMLATPVFAQSYSATYGTGNTVNLPLAEATNGALGVGQGQYGPQTGADVGPSSSYAYEPAQGYAQQGGYYGGAPARGYRYQPR